MMVDNIERDIGKTRLDAVVIPLPNSLRMSQNDEYICRDPLHRHSGLLCHSDRCTSARAANGFIKKSPPDKAGLMRARVVDAAA